MTQLVYRGVRYEKTPVQQTQNTPAQEMRYRGISYRKQKLALTKQSQPHSGTKMCYRGVTYWTPAMAVNHVDTTLPAETDLPLAA